MNDIISKELLSEVLACECIDCYFEDTYNQINYTYEYDVTWSEQIQAQQSSINIHELEHMCKEWATTMEYILLDFGKVVYAIPDHFDEDEITFSDYKSFHTKHKVFEACQWILDNKESTC